MIVLPSRWLSLSLQDKRECQWVCCRLDSHELHAYTLEPWGSAYSLQNH